MAPRQKCTALHRDALIVVDDLIRGVMGRLRECADVHGPLGGVILVKAGGLDLHDFDLVKSLIVLHPICKVLFHSSQIVTVMPPLILTLAVFVIVTGPCDIGRRSGGVFTQRKAPAVFQHDGL